MKAVIIAHGTLFDNQVLIRECESSEILLCADGGAE